MDILEVKGLSVKVEGKLILKDVNFSLKDGVSHILFEPNSSGKTTLISTLMSLPGYEVVSAQILFNGQDITQKRWMNGQSWARAIVSYETRYCVN